MKYLSAKEAADKWGISDYSAVPDSLTDPDAPSPHNGHSTALHDLNLSSDHRYFVFYATNLTFLRCLV